MPGLISTEPLSPKLQATYEKTGFKWRKTATRGLLEYKKSKFFIGLLLTLVGWGIVALLPLLMGNSGLMRMQCQRTRPLQGSCQIEYIYLHPALSFLNRKETLLLSQIRGVNVIEIAGDESDSYRLELVKTTGSQTLFTAMLESTAENRAEDLLYFLRTPQEEGVRIRYFDTFSFWIFYLPLYFMLFQFSIALFLKLSGQPYHCHWVVFDNQTRQLVTIHNTWLGWSFTKKTALGQIKNIEIKETEGENHDFFKYIAQLKTGKTLALTPNIRVEDSLPFEEMQADLLERMRKTLHDYQGNSLATERAQPNQGA